MSAQAVLRKSALSRVGDFVTGGAVLLVGLGVSLVVGAFFRLAWWREHLLGETIVPWHGIVGLELVLCAVAWRYLLRRGFVWTAPAVLTWADFAGAGRATAIGRRLWGTWLVLLALLSYAGALVAATYRASPVQWAVVGALLLGTGAVSLSLARRAVLPRGAGTGWPLGLALAGLLVVLAAPATKVLFAAAAVLMVVAVVLWVGTGSPLRPAVCRARRVELVANWAGRVVRSVAFSFADAMMLLPEARPVGSWRLRRPVVVWLAVAGVAGRVRYAAPALIVALAVAVAHRAAPALPEVVLVAFGGYLALIPFAGGLGELWHSAGRRRWVGSADLTVRLSHGLVIAGLSLLWGLVALGACALLGIALGPGSAWALLLVAATAVRTVTRAPMNYYLGTMVDTPFGLLPPGMIQQVVRGPDILVVGVWLLSAAPFGVTASVVLVAAAAGWALLR